MNELYPLKFKPLFKEKPWGGQRIRQLPGLKAGPMPNIGEAWLLSGLEGQSTPVSNGFLESNELGELIEVYMGDLVGDEVYEKYGTEFPLLFKILDTTEYLSIQVHPGDELARKRHRANGKAEMWYVLEAGEGAEIITGFRRPTQAEEFSRYLAEGRLEELLNRESAAPGDVFFTPPGRIHSIGPNLMLAEIQQASDITYRIHDWGRMGADGKSRELHTELALEAIDFAIPESYRTPYREKPNGTCSLLKSPYFHSQLVSLQQGLKKDYSELDSFVVLFCAEGSFTLVYDRGSLPMLRGEICLIPCELNIVGLEPHPLAKILEVYIH